MTRATTRRLAMLLALPGTWLLVALPGLTWLAPGDRATDDAVGCGVRLVTEDGGATPFLSSVRVAVVTDEEWRVQVPDDTGEEAREVVLEAAARFRGLGIHLLPVRDVAWQSPNGGAAIADIWQAAADELSLEGADVAVVLSAQRRNSAEDGYAEVGGTVVAVAHHPDDPALDALVLAHELSHLFGAHHGCDLGDRGGLMAETGFDELICPCTRQVLELNANRFHELVP